MELMNVRRAMMSVAELFPDAGLVENMTTGELTINEAKSGIQIRHNLGKRPDIIAIWGDFADPADIPNGCCVRCIFFRNPFTKANWTVNNMHYLYDYCHSTSGNILSGQSSSYASNFTETTANCARGSQNWKPTDANGNPITYKWVALCFKEA